MVTLGFIATSKVSHSPRKISVMKSTSAVRSSRVDQEVFVGRSSVRAFSGKSARPLRQTAGDSRRVSMERGSGMSLGFPGRRWIEMFDCEPNPS